MELDINDLVARSGVTRRTIYFYVQQGILPAAQSAGMGARYSEEHLTRLGAIPVLRRRGMRLDEIRAFFHKTGRAELEQLLRQTEAERGAAEKSRWQAQSLLRYTLSPGVELVVDARLTGEVRKQVLLLMEQAKAIFNQSLEG